MKAKLRFHRKVTLIGIDAESVGIAELKVFEVPSSSHYPEGLKY